MNHELGLHCARKKSWFLAFGSGVWAAWAPSARGAPCVSTCVNWWSWACASASSPAMGWYFITFFIFIGVLYALLAKKLGAYLKARSAQVQNAIQTAQDLEQEALKRLAACQERLSTINGEITVLSAFFTQEAQTQKASLIEQAQQKARNIRQDTDRQITQELGKMILDIKKQVVAQLIHQSRELFTQKSLNPQACLVEQAQFLQDISKEG